MWLGKLVWAITSLASLNVGLSQYGYGIRALPFWASLPVWAPQVVAYIVGLAGLISLLMMVRALSTCWNCDRCDDCGSKGCGCS